MRLRQCKNRRHPHPVNVCSFLSEVLHVRKQDCDFPLLSKPVHPEDLLKKVAEILNSSELHQVA